MAIRFALLIAFLLACAGPAGAGVPACPCDCSSFEGCTGDGDCVLDSGDNCTLVCNPSQCDTDGDGFGNHCDGDFNNDNSVDGADFNPIFIDDFGSGSQTGTIGTDMNCDGAVDGADFNPLFLDQFSQGSPGPGN